MAFAITRASPLASACEDASRWSASRTSWRSGASTGSASSCCWRSRWAASMLSRSARARKATNSAANALAIAAARCGSLSLAVIWRTLAFCSASTWTSSWRSPTEVDSPSLRAHAGGDRLGAGQQDVRRRLALGVVVGALELERRVRQRRRAEQDARAAVVAVAGADAGDHHADGEAGHHGQHDHEPAPAQHAERVAHGVALALGLEAQVGGGAHLAAPSGACSSRTSVISARKRARPKRRALARKR